MKLDEVQPRIDEARKKLTAALRAAGAKISKRYGGYHGTLAVNGQDVPLTLSADKTGAWSYSYGQNYSGKLRITVGYKKWRGPDLRRVFPEPKTGFDYAKIAACVIEYAEGARARGEVAEAKNERNYKLLIAAKRVGKLSDRVTVWPNSDAEGLCVRFEDLTEAEALAVVRALPKEKADV